MRNHLGRKIHTFGCQAGRRRRQHQLSGAAAYVEQVPGMW